MTAVGGLAMLAVYLFTGTGRVALFAGAHDVELLVDGQRLGAVPAHGREWLEVPRGTHQLKVGDLEWQVDVGRGAQLVLPLGGQCFVAFDVTNLLYELKGANEGPAVFDNPVAARFFDGQPFELPERTWLHAGELPRKMEYAERASLLQLVPCSKKDASDEELSDLAPRALSFP